jgi:hypothetical protein
MFLREKQGFRRKRPRRSETILSMGFALDPRCRSKFGLYCNELSTAWLRVPSLLTREDAERFVAGADLSAYGLSRFELLSTFALAQRKDARLLI